jgi:hypothetical protein
MKYHTYLLTLMSEYSDSWSLPRVGTAEELVSCNQTGVK